MYEKNNPPIIPEPSLSAQVIAALNAVASEFPTPEASSTALVDTTPLQ